jgi:integrase
MASIRRETGKREGWRLSYRLDGKRSTMFLGKVSEDEANTIKAHVEHLLRCYKSERPIQETTDRWLTGLPDKMYNKLATAGLVVPRKSASKVKRYGLVEWIDKYMDDRADVKASTQTTYQRARDSAEAFFGKRIRIDEVTRADAAKFQKWLATEGNRRNVKDGKKGVASATLRRTIGKMKQFFSAAVKAELIDQNPFEDFVSSVHENEDNFHFVPRQVIDDCIAVAESTDWKTIFALARYAGMRIPSELTQLVWNDIDFDKKVLVVRATKTEHHLKGGIRKCPLFPELMPYLLDARKAAGADAKYVVTDPKLRSAAANLRTGFLRHLKKAGHKPWPNLFNNLRKTRATELLQERKSPQSIARWLGHDIKILMKHYLIATDEEFALATRGNEPSPEEKCGDDCGDNSGRQARDCDYHPDEEANKKTPEKLGFEGQGGVCDGQDVITLMGGTELESVTSTMSTWRSNQLS